MIKIFFGRNWNGQMGGCVVQIWGAFGESLKPQDPLIMIWLPNFQIWVSPRIGPLVTLLGVSEIRGRKWKAPLSGTPSHSCTLIRLDKPYWVVVLAWCGLRLTHKSREGRYRRSGDRDCIAPVLGRGRVLPRKWHTGSDSKFGDSLEENTSFNAK